MDVIMIMSILGGLIALALLVGLVLVARRKRKEKKTDYKVFFTMGIIWLLMGVIALLMHPLFRTTSVVFLCLGASYLVVGLANKDKWTKSKKP